MDLKQQWIYCNIYPDCECHQEVKTKRRTHIGHATLHLSAIRLVFFFLSGFSFANTDDSQGRRGRRRLPL